MKPALLALSLSVLCCGGGAFDGADAVPVSQVPSGKIVSLLSPSGCVDARGKPVARPATTIRVLVREDGTPLLVEERPGYDALVIYNAFTRDGTLVFQAISDPGDAAPALHEYRIEWPSGERGRLAAAREFDVTVQVGGSFEARPSRLSLQCELTAQRKPRLDNPKPVQYEEAIPRASG